MPFGDRTGPWGVGPMTGRGMGYCAGFPAPGFMNPGYGFGRGFGLGGGFGRGRGRRWNAYWPSSGYPSPWAMPYGFPFPYGHPYGMGYPPYPYSPWTPQASAQQEQEK